MDKKYTVISIQLDNKYPEKQSVILFHKSLPTPAVFFLVGGVNKCFVPSSYVKKQVSFLLIG
ncbi:MAG: hypothetical protein ACLP9S_16780, partial [Syntrophales bacterium]